MKQKKTPLIIAIVSSILLIGTVGGVIGYILLTKPAKQNTANSTTAPQSTEESTDNSLLSFDKKRYSIDDPDSIWIITNKQRPLTSDFKPKELTSVDKGEQLRSEAAQALQQLIAGASATNISLRPISGYRSFERQKSVYEGYVKSDGQGQADTYSARPGYSEHQTGLGIDVGNGSGQCDLEICFATTAGGKWVAANAHTYGFIIRYSKDKTPITGYQYEPWHLRYVGVDLANELRSKNQTMEEFFSLPSAPTY